MSPPRTPLKSTGVEVLNVMGVGGGRSPFAARDPTLIQSRSEVAKAQVQLHFAGYLRVRRDSSELEECEGHDLPLNHHDAFVSPPVEALCRLTPCLTLDWRSPHATRPTLRCLISSINQNRGRAA
jgi:hypothetical protein